jgi:hypothetical protein
LPNLTSHVALALKIAESLNDSTVSEHLGSYLLGATAPDIRIINKQPREITHFSQLESTVIGDGVTKLLLENPDLSDGKNSSAATKAFVSGYITHLISDQTWIITMYRPYFGNREIFPNGILANIWDRALQLEMDKEDRLVWATVYPHLKTATAGVEIRFISLTDLDKWKDWIAEYALGTFSWDRLKSLARRQAIIDDSVVHQAVEDFLSDIPNGLRQITSNLGDDDLDSYRERAVHGSIKLIQNFLKE